ncbi:MAG: 23S rRNA (pseudouridine(1915)-N(3))-methyltransferase RlmH [Gemmatimonadota bacterium]
MYIAIATFQKSGRSPFAEAEADYVKRLSAHAEVELIALKPTPTAGLPERLTRSAHVVGLFPEGRSFDSEDLAAHLEALMNRGSSRLVFVIGGPDGMPPGVAGQVHERWSLSPLTFSHQLARLVLLEALYRSFDILRGGRRYHR